MTVTQTKCIACDKQLAIAVLSNAGVLCNVCARQGLFRKRIIITGITRMNQGHICVSGIDEQTWRFVRPIFATGIGRDFTMEGTTQVINHFNLVEIEFRRYRPEQIYHTEDWIINENFSPRFIKHLTDQEIIQVLNRMSVRNLNLAMQPQDKSLFIVKAQQITHIWDEISFDKFKVRMNFVDYSGNIHTSVPVTDLLTLAYVKYQKRKGNNSYSTELINAFNSNSNRYIRIGLTRLFREQYWKQVTALITVPDLFNNHSFSFYEKKTGEQV